MRAFKTKIFARISRRSKIPDEVLRDSASRAESGQIDATLGKFLIKQRVERPNEGRSGGFRAIVVFKAGDITVFVHMFPKNAQGNLSPEALEVFRELAKHFANLGEDEIERLVAAKEWIEIEDDETQEKLP
ncbi:type II toxin-antitoxin system RelE/ParE family toxin [Methylobacterium oryzisoli]|uniref:type II toxin-antitoxin system RelE/ParE family toxin n=1 Tax=Methylobacterium oryzisoli TaxID=3385502 RepID=UPI003891E283